MKVDDKDQRILCLSHNRIDGNQRGGFRSMDDPFPDPRMMQDMLLDPRMMREFSVDSQMEKLTFKAFSTWIMSGRTFDPHAKQVVGEIYKIQQVMGLLPELKEKPKKSDDEARKLRVVGNEAYKTNDLMGALRLYTKAICCAELGGEEMAMAYANRSAVTYGLQEYENAIEDVNRALSTGKYPKNLTQKLLERRGKCFLALSQYNRASADFKQGIVLLLETDIDTGKVNSIKAYLDLIEKCLGKKDMPMKSAVPQPKLTHGPSSYIQSASEAVDIKYSPEMGRHIVATVDIAPGDILVIEKPFASVLRNNLHDLYCNNCKRRCHSSIPCASCSEVVFCSELCRESSWKMYHSMECDLLHILKNLGCPETVLLAFRILLKATELGQNLHMFMDDSLNESEGSCEPEKVGLVDNMYLSDHYNSTHNLTTLIEQRTPAELLRAAITASLLVHVLKEATTFFQHSDCLIPSAALFKPVSDLQWNHIVAANLLMRYIMVCASNAYNTAEVNWAHSGDELELKPEETGSSVYSFCSLLNHSCDPDVFFCPYSGDNLIVCAAKPITKGQQIFSNYCVGYTKNDKVARQRVLRLHFRFTCKCTACLEDWPLIVNMPDEEPKFVSAKAKKRFQREIAKSGCDLTTILMAAKVGKMTEEHFLLLIKHFTLIHKYVKQPWNIYNFCQHAIARYFHLSLNPFTK